MKKVLLLLLFMIISCDVINEYSEEDIITVTVLSSGQKNLVVFGEHINSDTTSFSFAAKDIKSNSITGYANDGQITIKSEHRDNFRLDFKGYIFMVGYKTR